jgi:hypothetical protein
VERFSGAFLIFTHTTRLSSRTLTIPTLKHNNLLNSIRRQANAPSFFAFAAKAARPISSASLTCNESQRGEKFYFFYGFTSFMQEFSCNKFSLQTVQIPKTNLGSET